MARTTNPTLTEEEKLWRQGRMLVGVDEAGRGPLAGPVVAAAVAICLSDDALVEEFMKLGVRDSKFILPKKREQLYGILTAHTAVSWGVASVDEKAIDRINILQASLLAMKYAVDAMMKKYKCHDEKTVCAATAILVYRWAGYYS